MTIALNSVTSSPSYQTYVPPVQSNGGAGLADAAVALSAQQAVVASLGGSTGVTVYTPSGLLESLQQAGILAEPVSVPVPGSNTSYLAQQALQLGVIGTLTGSTTTSTSGIYNGAGVLADLPSTQASSNWADLLKSNPSLAGTVIQAFVNSSLLSTLFTTA
ncbi:hypothetical protein [Rugamonas apoptosis]|uniref:Uncharacterized protein n=1 Tax=Rugamonas apoptosis TaxID=2758570 RepID=A0A7W2FBE9_9BURK|nr:hypothetical protein [Rugamonas apoptosis]MBA5688550.1 hypothetical protein [Rugamonas apoptosis]